MGAVDLVLQVESPKSVTAGLQRIGRAGHNVGDVSKGRIFPKFRADLLECAVVARRMRDGEIETTVVPAQPARRARPADRGDGRHRRRVARAASCTSWSAAPTPTPSCRASCSTSVLDMLDGRYPSEEFAELRPRIVWDRVEDTIRARKGALQLAVTNAGTIPDRGLYGVHLPDGRRVGELDEEMVYEARPGQTFLLGASTWRIEEITRDRVIVTPAPGAPGRACRSGAATAWAAPPSWAGRSASSRARRSTASRPSWRPSTTSTSAPPRNLVTYLREQREATRVVPIDRTIVIERFRDEIGDWRLCVLSPFGGRVHAAWGAGAVRAHPRPVRPGVRRDLVGRRHHRPPARRRRAARRRAGAGGARRAGGAGGARAVGLRAATAPASARTPPARCCSRAPTRASARRCGSSG